jgi:hypothetical protein
MKNIFKNKLFWFFGIFLIILIFFILVNIIVNSFSSNCSNDSDCIQFNPNLCDYCNYAYVNKKYTPYLELKKNIKQFLVGRHFACLLIACTSREDVLYCNENRKCDAKGPRITFDHLISKNTNIYLGRKEFTMDKGGGMVLTVGIRNEKDSPLNYNINFESVQGPNGIGSIRGYVPNELNDWISFKKDDYTLPTSDPENMYKNLDAKHLLLKIPTDALSGTYNLRLSIIDKQTKNIYAYEDFFVIVK